MTTWNFRVLHDPEHHDPYRLIEVFYDDAGTISGWSETHPVGGDSIEELVADDDARHGMIQACAMRDDRYRVLQLGDLPTGSSTVDDVDDRAELIAAHINTLRTVLDMIGTGGYTIDDFPDLRTLGQLLLGDEHVAPSSRGDRR